MCSDSPGNMQQQHQSIIELTPAQTNVRIKCRVKSCIRSLYRRTSHVESSVASFQSRIGSTANLQVVWRRWSSDENKWTNVSESLGIAHGRGRINGRTLRLVNSEDYDMQGYYRCSLKGLENYTKPCLPHYTTIVRRRQISPTTDISTATTKPQPSSPQWAPPHFTSHTDQVTFVRSGSTVTLQCTTEGFPQPEIRWLKGYTAIGFTNNPHISQLANGSLRFMSVTRSDQDTYRCVAQNSHGQETATYVLYVG